jgi:hypothetical protein
MLRRACSLWTDSRSFDRILPYVHHLGKAVRGLYRGTRRGTQRLCHAESIDYAARLSDEFRIRSSMHDSSIECRQHLMDQHLDCRQPGEAAAVEHEVVDPQLDERLHLFDELRGGADEVFAYLVPVAFAHL